MSAKDYWEHKPPTPMELKAFSFLHLLLSCCQRNSVRLPPDRLIARNPRYHRCDFPQGGNHPARSIVGCLDNIKGRFAVTYPQRGRQSPSRFTEPRHSRHTFETTGTELPVSGIYRQEPPDEPESSRSKYALVYATTKYFGLLTFCNKCPRHASRIASKPTGEILFGRIFRVKSAILIL